MPAIQLPLALAQRLVLRRQSHPLISRVDHCNAPSTSRRLAERRVAPANQVLTTATLLRRSRFSSSNGRTRCSAVLTTATCMKLTEICKTMLGLAE
jgi:hypothetical protein